MRVRTTAGFRVDPAPREGTVVLTLQTDVKRVHYAIPSSGVPVLIKQLAGAVGQSMSDSAAPALVQISREVVVDKADGTLNLSFSSDASSPEPVRLSLHAAEKLSWDLSQAISLLRQEQP